MEKTENDEFGTSLENLELTTECVSVFWHFHL